MTRSFDFSLARPAFAAPLGLPQRGKPSLRTAGSLATKLFSGWHLARSHSCELRLIAGRAKLV